MGTSGNPSKRAASPASEFKKGKKGKVIQLPSGLFMQVRRVELRTFLQRGDVPNPLLPLVEEALSKGQNADLDGITGFKDGKVDLELVNEMYDMVNTVVCSVAIEPKVFPVPEDEDARDDDLLYVDEVDDEDKMFLFQWSIGGTDDVATFRREAEEGLVALAQGSGGGVPTE